MKVILREDISGLGKTGDIVSVASGYARNFLFPKDLAYEASKGHLKLLDQEKAAKERKAKREMKTAEDMAARISETSVTLKVKVGEGDRLYGSVTNRDLADALAKEGIEVDRHKIIIEEPLKTLGVYTVSVKLHQEITAKFKVWLEKE